MSNFLFNLNGTTTSEQKQQSITATYNLGTIRGKGSSTRIFTNCMTETKDNYDDCLNLVASGALLPVLPINGILFDISSFDKTFNIYGTGFSPVFPPGDPKIYIPLPPLLKIALISGVNRWKKFIEFSSDMVTLIRTISALSNNVFPKFLTRWNGIELVNVTFINFDNPNTLATCSVVGFPTLNTSINYGFNLEVKKTLFDSSGNLTVSQDYFNRIIAHELGHALNFPLFLSELDVRKIKGILKFILIHNSLIF